MILTETQLRMLIRTIIFETIAKEEDEEESAEEPVGDESIKKVYAIAKEVNNFL